MPPSTPATNLVKNVHCVNLPLAAEAPKVVQLETQKQRPDSLTWLACRLTLLAIQPKTPRQPVAFLARCLGGFPSKYQPIRQEHTNTLESSATSSQMKTNFFLHGQTTMFALVASESG
jgi:hypothetical protein